MPGDTDPLMRKRRASHDLTGAESAWLTEGLVRDERESLHSAAAATSAAVSKMRSPSPTLTASLLAKS
ncbi:MAG: hypothetical protein M3O15_15905, partial [Acidobacteriota bacterium]|nr:hypothetical protein [Acidobacteriota bacterium]